MRCLRIHHKIFEVTAFILQLHKCNYKGNEEIIFNLNQKFEVITHESSLNAFIKLHSSCISSGIQERNASRLFHTPQKYCFERCALGFAA